MKRGTALDLASLRDNTVYFEFRSDAILHKAVVHGMRVAPALAASDQPCVIVANDVAHISRLAECSLRVLGGSAVTPEVSLAPGVGLAFLSCQL